MKPIQQKRILAYRKFRNGFLVLGTGPDRHWVLAGGRPVERHKTTREGGQ